MVKRYQRVRAFDILDNSQKRIYVTDYDVLCAIFANDESRHSLGFLN